jgi:hypothetical protein
MWVDASLTYSTVTCQIETFFRIRSDVGERITAADFDI